MPHHDEPGLSPAEAEIEGLRAELELVTLDRERLYAALVLIAGGNLDGAPHALARHVLGEMQGFNDAGKEEQYEEMLAAALAQIRAEELVP